eukprot:jgi/Ulvmu1/1859/UM012_0015.1
MHVRRPWCPFDMATPSLPHSWTQELDNVDGCSKFRLHRGKYTEASRAKQWVGISQVHGPDRGFVQERIVCIVKGYVSQSRKDPFILLLANYMPSINKLCLTLPTGESASGTGEALEAAVQRILFGATGSSPVVRVVAIAPGECVGMPRVAPERVKVVTVEISCPPREFYMPLCGLTNGPRPGARGRSARRAADAAAAAAAAHARAQLPARPDSRHCAERRVARGARLGLAGSMAVLAARQGPPAQTGVAVGLAHVRLPQGGSMQTRHGWCIRGCPPSLRGAEWRWVWKWDHCGALGTIACTLAAARAESAELFLEMAQTWTSGAGLWCAAVWTECHVPWGAVTRSNLAAAMCCAVLACAAGVKAAWRWACLWNAFTQDLAGSRSLSSCLVDPVLGWPFVAGTFALLRGGRRLPEPLALPELPLLLAAQDVSNARAPTFRMALAMSC